MFTNIGERLKLKVRGDSSRLEACIRIDDDQILTFREIVKTHFDEDRGDQLYPRGVLSMFKSKEEGTRENISEVRGSVSYSISQGEINLHTCRGYLEASIESLGLEENYLNVKASGETTFVLDFHEYLQSIHENSPINEDFPDSPDSD